MAVAFLHELVDVFHDLVGVPPVGVGVERDGVTHLAAQQLVNRHPGALALDVPERHVEPAEHVVLDRAVAPIGGDVGALPEIFDAGRVFADPERRILLFDRGDDGGGLVDVAGRADAVQAGLAGEDFEKYPPIAGPGARGDGLHAGDFEVGQSADRVGIARGGRQKRDLQKCAALHDVAS